MNEKKYELTEETIEVCGITLYRIKALRDFADIKKGDVGGFIESEKNLSQENDAMVSGNARVYGNAWVSGNARVSGDAMVYGDAWIKNNKDYTTIKGFGRAQRTTTFFKTHDGKVAVSCGCFHGTLEEFEDKVLETHKDSKYAKEYLCIAQLMRYHFTAREEN